jgi:hypothetical protein
MQDGRWSRDHRRPRARCASCNRMSALRRGIGSGVVQCAPSSELLSTLSVGGEAGGGVDGVHLLLLDDCYYTAMEAAVRVTGYELLINLFGHLGAVFVLVIHCRPHVAHDFRSDGRLLLLLLI